MKTKRVLALLLCTVLVLALAACGTTTSSTSATGGSNTAGSSTSDASGEVVELVYSFWGNEDELASTQAVLDAYSEVNPNVRVTALQIGHDEYAEKLQTMAAAGNMPDAGMATEANVLGWAVDGLLSTDDVYAGEENKPLEYLTFKDYDGNSVAYSAANEVLALWYNRDMFDEAGIAYPPATLDEAWTWDEFIDVATQLTFDVNGNHPGDPGFDANSIEQYGCYVNVYTWQLEVWALSNGGKFFSEDGQSVVFDDAAIEGIQKVLDLYLVSQVAPRNDGTADNGFATGIGAGNVAMSTEGQWAAGNALSVDVDYGVGVLPYMETKANICTGGPTVVFAGTQHPEEAAAFVRWYMSPDYNFGVIEAGWWMPTLENWYTDTDLVASWVDDNPARIKIGVDNYKTAVMDVAMDLGVTQSTGWYYTPNTDIILNQILGPALVEATTGDKTVAEVVESVRSAMESALAQ